MVSWKDHCKGRKGTGSTEDTHQSIRGDEKGGQLFFCYIVGMNMDEADSAYVCEVWENEELIRYLSSWIWPRIIKKRHAHHRGDEQLSKSCDIWRRGQPMIQIWKKIIAG